MQLTRQTTDYLTFTAGDVEAITGVSRTLQAAWRRRGLLPELPEPGWVRFLPGEVLRMFTMARLTDASMSVKHTRWFTTEAATTATAILRTLPGVVRIVADPALGAGFEDRERAKLADHAATHRGYRYLIVPLPAREDAPGAPALYRRADLADLPDLIDADAPMALTLDCAAIARAFLARVRKVTDKPLETWTFTLERESGA